MQFRQRLQPIHQARTGAADQVVIEWVDLAGLDGSQCRPSRRAA